LQKALILFLALCITGCRINKFVAEKSQTKQENDKNVILAKTKENNIGSIDFEITKGNAVVKFENEERKFGFSVKHKPENIYLISIRNLTGIEGARIFLNGDTLKINDRINRKYLTGNIKRINEIRNFPVILSEIVFGDISETANLHDELKETNDNKTIYYQYKEGFAGKSVIDPEISKVISATWSKGPGMNSVTFRYSNFKKGTKIYPEKIEISSSDNSLLLKLLITKISFNEIKEINFIPGEGYKKEELK